MCLILLHWQSQAERRLTLAANRDEFLHRPTDAAHFWTEHPDILAGRDREFGGSWLGISLKQRFAAVTNLRGIEHSGEKSRGNLVRDFLGSTLGAAEFAQNLEAIKNQYRPFNLIISCGKELVYSNNTERGWQTLEDGLHVVGNISLSSSNPKVQKGAADFAGNLRKLNDHNALFALLEDPQPAVDSDEALERALSCRFVKAPTYGTRSSSVLFWNRDGSGDFWERQYDKQFNATKTRHFSLPGRA